MTTTIRNDDARCSINRNAFGLQMKLSETLVRMRVGVYLVHRYAYYMLHT